MKDIKRKISSAIKTGKVSIGSNSVIRTLLTGKTKLVILSEKCPRNIRDRAIYYSKLADIPCKIVKKSASELGSISGKSFSISTLAILEPGNSDIIKEITEVRASGEDTTGNG